MQINEGTMLLTEDESFGGECQGNRLFCVLVPFSRKLEFMASALKRSLEHCTDKFVFYAEMA